MSQKFELKFLLDTNPPYPIECDGCRYNAPLALFDNVHLCSICANSPCGIEAQAGRGIDPILQQIAYGTNAILDGLGIWKRR